MIFRRRTVRIELEQKTLRLHLKAHEGPDFCPHCGSIIHPPPPISAHPLTPFSQPLPLPASISPHTCPPASQSPKAPESPKEGATK